MSNLFQQVLQQLGIAHSFSSAFHPESQGALERFHQTLKTMLRAHSLEYQRDWDEGVPFLLFAVRGGSRIPWFQSIRACVWPHCQGPPEAPEGEMAY